VSTVNQVAYRILTAFDYSNAGDPVRRGMAVDAMNTAAKDIAIRTRVYERSFAQDLVLNTDTYTFPTGFFSIVRVVANSWHLAPMTKAEYDARVGEGTSPVPTGQPTGYLIWGRSIITFPKWGSTTVTNGLAWRGYAYPTEIALTDAEVASSPDLLTLGIPPEWERCIVDSAIATLSAWFKDLARARFHQESYERGVQLLFNAAQMARYQDQLGGVLPDGMMPRP
jgi:hypothetical protein